MLWGSSFPVWEPIVKIPLWIALGAGVVAAVAAFVAGYVGYELTDAIQIASDERIAELNKETVKLSAEAESSRAAIANVDARAAEASQKAAEANLALERLKAPRTLSLERQQLVAAATQSFARRRYRVAISQGADDGVAFWESMHPALQKARWVYLPSGGPSIGSPPASIPIAALPGIEIRFDPMEEQKLAPAALALGNALHADGTVVAVNRDSHSNPEGERDIV